MRHTLTISFFIFISFISYGQKHDTLTIIFSNNRYDITQADKNRIDSFTKNEWTSFLIIEHTDDIFTSTYNEALSKKRAESVRSYLLKLSIDTLKIAINYFGERSPKLLNISDENRSKNRRVEVVKRYQPDAPADLGGGGLISSSSTSGASKPVTTTLKNGIIVTYKPGSIPISLETNFKNNSGANFNLITNVSAMQANSILTNTTSGSKLASLLICCFDKIEPCKLDTPFTIKFPISNAVICPLDKIKFFFSKIEDGKKIWQEQSKDIYPEIVDGKLYISLTGTDFCDNCINFDYVIEPDCFDTENSIIEFDKSLTVSNFYVTLKGLNSLYSPKKQGDKNFEILHITKQLDNTILDFSVVDKKGNVFDFKQLKLSKLKFDTKKSNYFITRRMLKIETSQQYRIKTSANIRLCNIGAYRCYLHH